MGPVQRINDRWDISYGAGGRVLVVELIMPPGNEPSFGKTQDINMLINVGGSERTEAQHRALFQAAGLELTRCIPIMGELHVIEGVPAGH